MKNCVEDMIKQPKKKNYPETAYFYYFFKLFCREAETTKLPQLTPDCVSFVFSVTVL